PHGRGHSGRGSEPRGTDRDCRSLPRSPKLPRHLYPRSRPHAGTRLHARDHLGQDQRPAIRSIVSARNPSQLGTVPGWWCDRSGRPSDQRGDSAGRPETYILGERRSRPGCCMTRRCLHLGEGCGRGIGADSCSFLQSGDLGLFGVSKGDRSRAEVFSHARRRR
ncbi:MAG: hypothetical protein JWO49_1710, partial [Arthrobacter sp.]|nr:hypothetical protein [Arthrobacter sp.]